MVNADRILERMRVDAASGWASRLLAAITVAPLVQEQQVGWAGNRAHRPAAPLTPGERLCLQAASVGLRERESAVVLGLSREAVKDRLRQARRKLRAKNTTHAVALAIREGVL